MSSGLTSAVGASETHREFSFPTLTGGWVYVYRCRELESLEETRARAEAAHLFFEQRALDNAQGLAKEMWKVQSGERPASELNAILEEADADLRQAAEDTETRFQCSIVGEERLEDL